MEENKSIMDRAVALSVSVHGLGNHRAVPKGTVKTDIDQDWLHVGKQLLEADSYEAIKSLDAKMSRWLKMKCLPSLFRHGVYLLPIELVELTDTKLQEYANRRRELVDAFCAEYPALVESAKGPLATGWNESDYPPVEQVKAAFYVKTEYLTFSTPTSLKGISKALWEREKDKAERQWKDAGTAISDALTESMLKLVDGIAKSLCDNENGKRKKIFSGPIDRFSEFLETFKFRNLGDDDDLAKLVEQAKGLLNGTDAVILRSDDDLRKKVQEGFSEIKTSLDKLIVDRPSRMISFEE